MEVVEHVRLGVSHGGRDVLLTVYNQWVYLLLTGCGQGVDSTNNPAVLNAIRL